MARDSPQFQSEKVDSFVLLVPANPLRQSLTNSCDTSGGRGTNRAPVSAPCWTSPREPLLMAWPAGRLDVVLRYQTWLENDHQTMHQPDPTLCRVAGCDEGSPPGSRCIERRIHCQRTPHLGHGVCRSWRQKAARSGISRARVRRTMCHRGNESPHRPTTQRCSISR